jgi:type IV secretion system protein VirB7
MTPTPVLILLAAALGGCATSTAKSLPVCDGQHRRPANPYGSVLDPAPATAGAPTPAAPASPAAPTPPPAATTSPSGCGA